MANMKMTATATKQGFTLVELIVVITILAILGTIGFISLQGYSAQSRDSKRTSDLRSLSTAVTTKSTEGLNLLSFVGTQGNLVTTSATLWLAGTGSTGITTSAGTSQNYSAGVPNNTVLGINAANFNDPNTNAPYKIGATTLAGGSFQLAARLEASGNPTAEITGNYNARVTTDTTFGTWSTTSDIITIVSSGVGRLKKWDWISGTAGIAANTQILSVSGDGLTIKLNKLATATSITGISLSQNEITGLIGTTGGVAITDNQTTNLPY